MEESSSTSMSGEIKKMLLLQSSDGKQFEVAELAAGLSVTIKHMMEDGVADGVIPLPNVTGVTLAKVLEYCNKHAPRPTPSEEQEMTAEDLLSIKEWDKEYVKGVDTDTLYDLILAANFLEVQGLLSLTCQRVADMIKGKTPEQIRQTFNIKNDFTPEEEEAVRKENQWAFETE